MGAGGTQRILRGAKSSVPGVVGSHACGPQLHAIIISNGHFRDRVLNYHPALTVMPICSLQDPCSLTLLKESRVCHATSHPSPFCCRWQGYAGTQAFCNHVCRVAWPAQTSCHMSPHGTLECLLTVSSCDESRRVPKSDCHAAKHNGI